LGHFFLCLYSGRISDLLCDLFSDVLYVSFLLSSEKFFLKTNDMAHVSLIDWLIIIFYLIISLGIGFLMSKRAGKNTSTFFLSGRNLPWYIAGTSMVATTFAADTPLAVTELVAKNGIAGNWLWWNMMFGGMLTVFFFARLWRRAGILTDAEFVNIRYAGWPARFLRGFRAVYIGILMNVIVIAWVNLAMVKILTVMFPGITFFGLQEVSFLGFTFSAQLMIVFLIMLFVATYSSLAGLMGSALTDTFQFFVAITGTIILAVVAVRAPEVGGIAGLQEKLPDFAFRFVPVLGSSGAGGAVGGALRMTVLAFFTYVGVQWWSSWYPGSEPGGGGYVAQRMMSAKDEKNSLLATLWFQVAHFAVRPWPWIIVGLVALVLYPDLPLAQKGDGYVMIIRDMLPAGLLGLLLAAFLAAYMSTIASQTNWGTSYIINDLFKPFIKKGADERYYVKIARITTFLLIIFSLFITSKLDRISDAWIFILNASAGVGLVLIFRWFWWRINAWSEITAIIAPFFILPFIYSKVEFPYTLLIIVGWTTFWWLLVTFLTRPESDETLQRFYSKVHPGGKGWKRVANMLPDVVGDTGFKYLFLNWFLGLLLVLFSLFGTGKIIFGDYVTGAVYFVIALFAGIVISRNFDKLKWAE
jgi:solute:Na+ symporter, SSS family